MPNGHASPTWRETSKRPQGHSSKPITHYSVRPLLKGEMTSTEPVTGFSVKARADTMMLRRQGFPAGSDFEAIIDQIMNSETFQESSSQNEIEGKDDFSNSPINLAVKLIILLRPPLGGFAVKILTWERMKKLAETRASLMCRLLKRPSHFLTVAICAVFSSRSLPLKSRLMITAIWTDNSVLCTFGGQNTSREISINSRNRLCSLGHWSRYDKLDNFWTQWGTVLPNFVKRRDGTTVLWRAKWTRVFPNVVQRAEA